MKKEEAIAINQVLEEQAVGFGLIVLKPLLQTKTKGGIEIPQEVLDKQAKDIKTSRLIVISVGSGVTENVEVGDEVRCTQAADLNGTFESPVEGYEIRYARQHDIMTIKKG
jgi:hypothetical protein